MWKIVTREETWGNPARNFLDIFCWAHHHIAARVNAEREARGSVIAMEMQAEEIKRLEPETCCLEIGSSTSIKTQDLSCEVVSSSHNVGAINVFF